MTEPVAGLARQQFGVEALHPAFGQVLHALAEFAGVEVPVLALLRNYADAVGHAPLMPSFAAGFIASKDRYNTQKQCVRGLLVGCKSVAPL